MKHFTLIKLHNDWYIKSLTFLWTELPEYEQSDGTCENAISTGHSIPWKKINSPEQHNDCILNNVEIVILK